jgi:hypothetical protein
MKKFEEPEIKVVMFDTPDILTDSTGGYADNVTIGYIPGWAQNTVVGGLDGDVPL